MHCPRSCDFGTRSDSPTESCCSAEGLDYAGSLSTCQPGRLRGYVNSGPEGPFLEEFNSSLSHVLNGCVYGLLALYDLIDGMGYSELKPLAASLESCLAQLAPRFTIPNGWSLYSLDTYGYALLASIHYHRSHIRMFRLLSGRTGHVVYGDAAERWERALNSRAVRCSVLVRKSVQVVWMRDVLHLPLAKSIWK